MRIRTIVAIVLLYLVLIFGGRATMTFADEPVDQPDTMDFEVLMERYHASRDTDLERRKVRALEKIAHSLKKMEKCK